MFLSIVIPTHDRVALLRRTLASLADVDGIGAADVEVIVVANACTDDTLAAARATQVPYRLRVADEPTVGLNVARNRGVAEAAGEVIALLDDDVFVFPGWLAALREAYATADVGVVAGRVLLWWEEVARPPTFCPAMAAVLSEKDLGDAARDCTSAADAVGANFSFRRSTFERAGAFRVGIDRTGRSLLGGGDSEFLLRALRTGTRMRYAPGACVKHWVPARRIEPPYLRGVAIGGGASHLMMRAPHPRGRLVRMFVGNAYLAARHAIAATLARAPAAAMQRRLTGWHHHGRMRAAWSSLTGRPL